jgi:hypothetical protein
MLCWATNKGTDVTYSNKHAVNKTASFNVKDEVLYMPLCSFKTKAYTHHHIHGTSGHNWFQSFDVIHHPIEYLGVSLDKQMDNHSVNASAEQMIQQFRWCPFNGTKLISKLGNAPEGRDLIAATDYPDWLFWISAGNMQEKVQWSLAEFTTV